MTKHTPDEVLLRGHAVLADVDVAASLADLVEKNVLSLCGAGSKADSEVEASVQAVPVKAAIEDAKGKLGKTVIKLYDLESRCGPEKPRNIELDVELYQMENW